jgi:ribosome maturation factor RimP
MGLDKNNIRELVEKLTVGTEFFLVDVSVNRSNLIQVYLDHPNGISLDDCARFSRDIEEALDRGHEDFELQVSSPGLGQPLKVFQQFLKATGEKMEILMDSGEKIKGTLVEARPGDSGAPAGLILHLQGTRKKPASADPVEILCKDIKSARIELDFK